MNSKPDLSCVPYRRKGVYLGLTIPFLLVLLGVFIYLWSYHFLWAVLFALFWVDMCFFQAYCCAYQECPYVGRFCPGLAGIVPASWLAKLLYGRQKPDGSKRTFEIWAGLAVVGLVGLIVFPLYWLVKFSIWAGVGYVAFQVVYYGLFMLAVCPACAIRQSCPGGRVQAMVLRKEEEGR